MGSAWDCFVSDYGSCWHYDFEARWRQFCLAYINGRAFYRHGDLSALGAESDPASSDKTYACYLYGDQRFDYGDVCCWWADRCCIFSGGDENEGGISGHDADYLCVRCAH